MLRLWVLSALLLAFAATAMAQDVPENPAPQPEPSTVPAAPAAPRNMPKYDLSFGYTLQRFTPASNTPHINLQGWYASLNYNFFTWLGVEGQLSGDYKFQAYPNSNISIYSFVAGPRIYPLRHHKLEPWVHILYGGAVYVARYPAFNGSGATTNASASKSLEGGGGFDLNKWKHWGIRLIEIDYQRTQFTGFPFVTLNGSYSQPSYRFSFGFTYRIGEK